MSIDASSLNDPSFDPASLDAPLVTAPIVATPRPEISVIVPHYNDLEGLEACLQSLGRQTIDRERFEIIVADNATPGGLGDMPVRSPKVRFLTVVERGAACARNTAMQAARGEVFAFIDADCIAAPDWLEAGLAGLAACDLVGGGVDVTVATPGAPSAVECFEKVFAFRQKIYVERKGFSVTANLIVGAETARAVGPFVNGVAEDLEWCRRARALGFHLTFNDRARVAHPARREWSDLVQKWDRLVRERWNGFGAHGAWGRLKWACLAGATALSAAPHMAAVATSDRLQSLRERAMAASTLTRIRLWRARRMLALLR